MIEPRPISDEQAHYFRKWIGAYAFYVEVGMNEFGLSRSMAQRVALLYMDKSTPQAQATPPDVAQMYERMASALANLP